jgi:hypothetical protein
MKALLAALCGASGMIFCVIGGGMLLFGSCLSCAGDDLVRNDQIGTGTVAGGAVEVAGWASDGFGVGLLMFGGALVVIAVAAAFMSGRNRPRGPIHDAWE